MGAKAAGCLTWLLSRCSRNCVTCILQTAYLQRSLHRGDQAGIFDRFYQVVESSGFHAVNGRFHLIGGGHDDNGYMRIVAAYCTEQFPAGNVGHEKIKNDNAYIFCLQERQDLPAVIDGLHLPDPGKTKQRFRRKQNMLFVVNQQDC